MDIQIDQTAEESGVQAARAGAAALRSALEGGKEATIIVATGASQFHMLAQLVREPDIAWDRVTAFHLDEYVGLPITHDASFRKYLWQRFVSQLPLPLRAFHYLDGEGDPVAECRRAGELIRRTLVNVAFIGIGENAHIAFNDPPADFEAVEPYLVVELDEACRRQQFGEGWFPTFEDVPTHAISMSVREILRVEKIICTVPDERKARAVSDSVKGEVTEDVPASILQTHGNCSLYLDQAAASLL